MPPKPGPRDPYGPGSPLLAPVRKTAAAASAPPAKTTTAPVAEAAAAAAAPAPAPAPAPAKKTRRRRRGKRGKKGAAGSAKKTTAKSPSSSSSSASTAISGYNFRNNGDLPDKSEILSDILDLISMHEEQGDNEEVARLYKIYYGIIHGMTEKDKVNLGKVEE